MEEPLTTQPLIIEFIGFTGAGKSTIERELVRTLRHQGLNAEDTKTLIANRLSPEKYNVRSVRRFAFYVRYLIRNWKFVWSVTNYVLNTKPLRFREMMMMRHIFFLDSCYKEMRSGNFSDTCEVAICSDGLLQIIWTLTLMKQAPSRDDLTRLLEPIAETHGVHPVIFRIDAEEAYRRICGRDESNSRLANLTREETIQRLESNRETLEEIYQISRKHSFSGSSSVDASMKMEAVLQTLTREIWELSRSKNTAGAVGNRRKELGHSSVGPV